MQFKDAVSLVNGMQPDHVAYETIDDVVGKLTNEAEMYYQSNLLTEVEFQRINLKLEMAAIRHKRWRLRQIRLNSEG